jgi:DNA invertase Pin-like site-specific DNA recombinase
VRAVAYARFSTVKQRDASIEDQFRECERVAAREKMTVVARFSDEEMSGGTAKRPGYQAMLAAARAGEFDVLITEDIDRLWRNRAEFGPRSAELEDLGVHWLSCVGDDTRREGWGITIQIKAAMAEGERRKVSYRTRRGQEGVALAGTSAGGRAYGFVPAARSGSGETEIDREQAQVVVRIFEQYADGVSPRAIAAQLNADKVPSPGAAWRRTSRRKDGKWLASALHGDAKRGSGILNNRRYIGVISWGKTEWKRSAADSSVRRVKVLDRARVERTDERLRIIPPALWERVKARQAQQRARVGAQIRGALRRNNPGQGRAPQHVLSGLLRCGVCEARFTMGDARAYACASYLNGNACTNHIRVRRTLVEERILATVKRDLRDPAVLQEVVRRVTAVCDEQSQAPRIDERRSRLIADLERQISRFVSAIGDGTDSPALRAQLLAAEAELARLKVDQVPRRSERIVLPEPKVITKLFLALVKKLEVRLAEDPEQARPALIEAIGDRIVLQPDSSGRFLWAEYGLAGELLASLGKVLEIMVAGAGFDAYLEVRLG